MKIGVFTPLLSALPLDQVLKKLKTLGIEMVEFGTGNYPGDAHAHLSMLDDPQALSAFKGKIADAGMTISALSSHGNPPPPRQGHRKEPRRDQQEDHPAVREAGRGHHGGFFGLPRRRSERPLPQLG